MNFHDIMELFKYDDGIEVMLPFESPYLDTKIRLEFASESRMRQENRYPQTQNE